MGAEPTLAEIIREAIESRLLDLHVAMPARVEAYDASTQTVEVLPMIRRAILDTAGGVQHEELPKISNVPVMFPSSAAFSATFPLAKGDFVMLVFNSSAIGNWRETGDLADPGDLRRHDLSYPVAFPGMHPNAETVPTAADAAVLEVNPPATHVKVGAGASAFVSRDDKVQQRLGELHSAMSGAVVIANDGGASLKATYLAALAPAWSGTGTSPDTAATKLKSE